MNRRMMLLLAAMVLSLGASARAGETVLVGEASTQVVAHRSHATARILPGSGRMSSSRVRRLEAGGPAARMAALRTAPPSALRGCEKIERVNRGLAGGPSPSSTAPAQPPPPRFRRLRMTVGGREATQHSGLSTQDSAPSPPPQT